jgi:hypothetical protein
MITLIEQTEEYVDLDIDGTTVSVTMHPEGELDFYLGDHNSEVILDDEDLLNAAGDWVTANVEYDF